MCDVDNKGYVLFIQTTNPRYLSLYL